MLYPSELSSGRRRRHRTGCSSRCRPPLGRRHRETSPGSPRHAHHGSAARTGRAWEPAPLKACVDVSYGRPSPAGHACGASPAPMLRRRAPRTARAEASGRSAPAPVWECPCLGGHGHRMLQGEAERLKRFDACASLGERRNKTPPGGNPRAFAWPREIGVTDLRGRDQSVVGARPSNTSRSRGAHRPASRPMGDMLGRWAMRTGAFMVRLEEKERKHPPAGERRSRRLRAAFVHGKSFFRLFPERRLREV